MAAELVTVLVEILLPLHMFEGLLHENRRPYRALLYYTVYGVVLALGTFYIPVPLLRAGIIFLISLVGNYFTYKIKPMPCLYITVLYYVTLVLSDVLCAAALTLAGYGTDFTMGGSERFVYLVLVKFLNLLLVQIVLLIFKRDKPRSISLISTPLLLCHILSFFACYRSFFAITGEADSEILLLTTLCLMVVNIVICFYVKLLESYYQRKNAAVAAGKLSELQRQYFEAMIARQDETRALWHDIKKYVSAMETLVNADKTADAEKCFAEIREKYERVSNSVDVGNSVIDSILSDALRRARDADIDLRLDVWVAPELDIPPADLYIIIGNTIDNAFEACRELPKGKKTVELLLRQSNHLLYYEIRNPYLPDTPPKQDRFHGYGLRNVRACVEKDKGSMEISSTDGIFTVSVQLNV